MKLAPLALSLLLGTSAMALADEAVLPGHSAGGEAFNEGPRQQAVLMGGTGNVHFPISAKTPEIQQFFDQGVGQLHGFWYFEAERSFRQVAALDPNCAMAYWGMAMANVNNVKRAADFIKKASTLKAKATKREQLWISALADYYADQKKDEKLRRTALVTALERLNGVDDTRALNSAAQCGQSAPAIAHMWHMAGHTYSKLHRYADAAWAQEASARVDHAYMAGARILPEEIHNYAHNNDWCVEDLEYIGRAHDAMDLARNMVELPRIAPMETPVGKRGVGAPLKAGYTMGRARLIETALRYELWPELTALEETMYLAPADDPQAEMRRLCALGVAHYAQGHIEQGDEKLFALQTAAEPLLKTRDEKDAKADAKPEAGNKRSEKRDEVAQSLVAELRTYKAVAHGQPEEAREQLKLAKKLPAERQARLYFQLGDGALAEKTAREAAEHAPGEVTQPATLAHIQWELGKKSEAAETFKKLRPLCAQADLDTPIFAELAPIARDLKLPENWRPKLAWNPDTGERPPLASLGPFRWQPYAAPAWSLSDDAGQLKSLGDYHGKPLLVVFYLGSVCSRCLEQLNLFSPMTAEYAKAGISIVAVSTEGAADLQKTFAKAKDANGFAFPILADPSLAAFKAYRAYDDFEKIPLHGLFLIDGQGQVRWQNISFEAFRDPKWLLGEARRLLALTPGPTEGATTASR